MIENESRIDARTELFDWMESLVVTAAMVIVLLIFVFRLARVNGTSMVPTLRDGDTLMVSTLFYEPARGDIVVISQPNFTGNSLVKRIVATGDETVDIDFDAGIVYVDGTALDEPYIADATHDVGMSPVDFPLTVPEGMVFVMGDNRNFSTDSRSQLVGLIDDRYIEGRLILRVWPFGSIGKVR